MITSPPPPPPSTPPARKIHVGNSVVSNEKRSVHVTDTSASGLALGRMGDGENGSAFDSQANVKSTSSTEEEDTLYATPYTRHPDEDYNESEKNSNDDHSYSSQSNYFDKKLQVRPCQLSVEL